MPTLCLILATYLLFNLGNLDDIRVAELWQFDALPVPFCKYVLILSC
jgi:hypothetical protein